MLLQRCCFHPKYGHRFRRFLRVGSWRGWRIRWSDGICRSCAVRWKQEFEAWKARREHPVLALLVMLAGLGAWSLLAAFVE